MFAGGLGETSCDECPAGTYSESGAAACDDCFFGGVVPATVSQQCGVCDSSTPDGAVSCCPAHADTWPEAGILYTAPGKSEMELYVLSACDAGLLSAERQLTRSSSQYASNVSMAIVSSGSGEITECLSVACASLGCIIHVTATTDSFAPGDSVALETFVDTVDTSGVACPSAAVEVRGFGCAEASLTTFFFALIGVVGITVLAGLLLEVFQHCRITTEVVCSMGIRVPSDAVLPTNQMLFEAVLRGLDVPPRDLPPSRFFARLLPQVAGAPKTIAVDFAVRAHGDHVGLRRRLLQLQWSANQPPSLTDSAGHWASVSVDQQLPTIVKAHGQAPGVDLVEMLEGFVLTLTGGHDRGGPGMSELETVRASVAHALLRRFSSWSVLLAFLAQYCVHLTMMVFLPVLGHLEMESCEAGFPWYVHLSWVSYMLLTTLVNLLVIRCCGGPQAGVFLWRFRARIALRCIFSMFMLTDTYQDVTFPVIANACSFDLWFVSAWLVVLGVGVMQVLAQLLSLLRKYWIYRRVRTPEDRSLILVQSVFLILRGSDNLPLVYAIRPAVEERLGGASSWAMKMSEARIAFLRFMFEDIEQSALQLVFLVFYSTASGDQLWVTTSLASSIFFSFALVVQVLPEVRDWFWHRVLVKLFMGQYRAVRLAWILVLLVLYRAASAIPWVQACSPSGDSCDFSGCYVFICCTDGELGILGMRYRGDILLDVVDQTLLCLCGFVSALVFAASVWIVRAKYLKRVNQGAIPVERYDHGDRFTPLEGTLRPWVGEENDAWLQSARTVHAAVVVAGRKDLAKLVQNIDKNAFKVSRGRASPLLKNVKTLSNADVREFDPPVVEAVSALAAAVQHVNTLADLRTKVKRLLRHTRFLKGDLEEKREMIAEATAHRAPLVFVHHTTIENLGQLPMYQERDDLRMRGFAGKGSIVPFFVSHRWLRTRGPRSGHRPDSEDHVKARALVHFARWFIELSAKAGYPCEVVFWIDWCCCEQVDAVRMEMMIAALPLYIAACTKVLVWRTPDFEVRCWTMVERLMTYSLCSGGLCPFVISEAVFLATESDKGGSFSEVAPVGTSSSKARDAEVIIERRSRKLPNPLDVDICQVTRASDRRAIKQLVDFALEVPALEVFADRQPVEWGLTEIMEQSLISSTTLPTRWSGPEVAEPWLVPGKAHRGEWRLVVRNASDVVDRSSLADDADAFLWIDHGAPYLEVPPTPRELDRCFDEVDAKVARREDPTAALETLIAGLRADLHHASTVPEMEAAITRAREVELPEKQQAVERVVTSRLQAALDSGSEALMRAELRMARQSGAGHVDLVKRVVEEQSRLYARQLGSRLRDQLLVATDPLDVKALAAVHFVAVQKRAADIEQEARRVVLDHISVLQRDGDVQALTDVEVTARQSEWDEVAQTAAAAVEMATLAKGIAKAVESQNVPDLRKIAEAARQKGLRMMASRADSEAAKIVDEIGEKLGLPSDWDVEDLLSKEATRRVRKEQETDRLLLDRVQYLVNDTFFGWGGLGKRTRTRDRKGETIPDFLEVVSVVHVQNAESYVNYSAKRRAVVKTRLEDHPGAPLITNWNVKTCRVSLEGVGKHGIKALRQDINECYLFHGTSSASAEAITDTDFDMKRSGSAFGSMFGAGLYFAESSLKADEYAQADDRGLCAMLLSRVVLGAVNYVDDLDPSTRAKELQESCMSGTYDSIIGDREKVRKTFREFVVFDSHQVYPEYIISYRRR